MTIPVIDAVFTDNQHYITLELMRGEVEPYQNTVYVNITRVKGILSEGAISCSEGAHILPYSKFDLSLSHHKALQIEVEKMLDTEGTFVLKLAGYSVTFIHFQDGKIGVDVLGSKYLLSEESKVVLCKWANAQIV